MDPGRATRTASPSTLTVTGIVGEGSLLPCLDTDVGKRAGDDIRVYWQVASRIVHSFYSGGEHSISDQGNKARLFSPEFKHGNFSLLLTDLRVRDAASYTCLVQLKHPTQGHSVVLQVTVTLQVAAHFAEPTLNVDQAVGQRQGEGGAWRLTCSSWGGYPAPAVGWTSGLLNLDPNGTANTRSHCSAERLCNVTSVLGVPAGVHSITCSIRNTRLQENHTVTFSSRFQQEYTKEMVESVRATHHRWIVPATITAFTLLLLLLYLLMGHLHKSQLNEVTYRTSRTCGDSAVNL
ncbi:CD276 antigen-like [Rhinoraja longicauda]